MQHKKLYFGVLISLLFLVLFAMGKGFWGGSVTGIHWTEKLFFGICHQIPERTFHINDYPMAVNSRCFGIFSGLFAGWLLIPLLNRLSLAKNWTLIFLLVATMLQIIDYSGNLFSVWENTNESRVFLGSLFGIACSAIIADQFKTSNLT